ncbi:amino acid adenylation domain-containing protein [Amycolatopsis sp. NPDC057786]|uniref:amino acid adenylation domain-containing protein n=1 Tax=Amycolatopsis sp. NPDC057786 TaxID=3346250 RepID=UPI00366ACD3D
MSISFSPSASRDGALRDGDTAVAGLFDALGAEPAEASANWAAGTAGRLAAITGGDPVLCWTVVAAATAVVLRRFGAYQGITLQAGPPSGERFPLFLRPLPELTVRDWLGEVRVAVAEAMTHETPGESHTLELVWGDRPGTAPLALACDAHGVRARSTLADAARLRYLVDGIGIVLEEGLHDLSRTVSELGVLDDATTALLAGFNETAPLDSTVPYRELLLRQAHLAPGAPAVEDDTESFGYAELCRHATAIALRLRAEGIGRESLVALAAPRDAWFLVTAVGILFAGAAYMPVDPATPPARQTDLIERADALIAVPGVPGPAGRPRFDLAELRNAPDGDVTDLGPAPEPGDLAYAIFTSGSTGRPKGACIEHRSFLNLLATRVPDYGLRPGTIVPQTAPLTFDLSIWQMFAGLTAGATVRVVPDDTVRDPAALLALAVRHRFGCLALVPTYIAVLLDELRDDPGLTASLREHLKLMISTGEVLSPGLAARWHDRFPRVPLLNAYGPAEVADDTTGGPVGPDEPRHTPIGLVLPNVTVHILDPDQRPVPPGVTGEIHIGGRSVGRGYLGEPAMTASSFVPDPFATVPGSRLYRTGDLGYWRADGAVVLLGRADSQVKIRGRRVEIGEIEHLLETSPDVARATVELLDEHGLARLVAFGTAAPGRRLDAEELRRFAAERLPDYMVPNQVIVLDSLPWNANGKVDRRALRAVAAEKRAHEEYVAPRTPVEETLCEVWAAHLPTADRIGIRHEFFALGGDSIVGIRIVQEAKRRGIALRPRHILEHPTVENLAEVAIPFEDLSEANGEPNADSGPLTPAQLSFLAREVPNPDHWNHGVSYDLGRGYELGEITAAVRVLARRHPAVRTRLDLTGEPRQYASPEAPPVTEFDLTGVPAAEVEERAHRAATELHETLDLRSGPVARFGLLRIDGAPDRLVVVIHHLMVDLFSWDLITDELSAILRDGDDGALARPGPSPAAWAAALTGYVRTDPTRLDVGHWLDRDWSGTAQVVQDGVAGVEGAVGDVRTLLDEAASQAIAETARERGLSVYECLLGALGTALREWTGADGEMLVQLGGHGREDVLDLDPGRIVGYFNSAYPFALPLSADSAEIAALHRAVPGRGFDFETARFLHPDAEVRARLSALPRPRLLFNFWGTPAYLAETGNDGALGAVRIEGTGADRDPAMPRPYALECYAVFAGSRLSVSWLHSADLLPADRVRALANAFIDALPTLRPGSLS